VLGFLSASEITTLKIDADCVVLSACNTASGSGEVAEALSDSFYVGEQALLAEALSGLARARNHGGASTGAKTPEGRRRIAEAQRRRWARWRGGRGEPGMK
jgi:CHAT domain